MAPGLHASDFSASGGALSGSVTRSAALIVPHIYGSFPLVETAKALSLIESRKVTGKVIVKPQL
jgi:hypothetical protein